MSLPRTARSLLIGAAFVALLLGAIGGCLPRRTTSTPRPAKLKPIDIDWTDAGSVVEGFFDAKKRGDWKKAYSCCDFEERLGSEEAKKIRDEWKQDAANWPEDCRNIRWLIADVETRDDLALVTVVRVRNIGPGALDAEKTGFDELCKRYGDRWKITEFEVLPK